MLLIWMTVDNKILHSNQLTYLCSWTWFSKTSFFIFLQFLWILNKRLLIMLLFGRFVSSISYAYALFDRDLTFKCFVRVLSCHKSKKQLMSRYYKYRLEQNIVSELVIHVEICVHLHFYWMVGHLFKIRWEKSMARNNIT